LPLAPVCSRGCGELFGRVGPDLLGGGSQDCSACCIVLCGNGAVTPARLVRWEVVHEDPSAAGVVRVSPFTRRSAAADRPPLHLSVQHAPPSEYLSCASSDPASCQYLSVSACVACTPSWPAAPAPSLVLPPRNPLFHFLFFFLFLSSPHLPPPCPPLRRPCGPGPFTSSSSLFLKRPGHSACQRVRIVARRSET
jgi:hypothetical protein